MNLKLLLATALIFSACSTEEDDETTTATTVTWTNTAARTVIVDNCASSSCHGGTTAPNFSTMNQDSFVAYRDSNSRSALDRMNGTGNIMPPAGALDQTDIDTVSALFD